MDNEALELQEQLLPFLSDRQSYPDDCARVRQVQTHCSFVFIAGEFVYKIKKAVDLGFLDFSTLEKRKHFCEREIELNRRLTTDIYLEVLPITKTVDGFAFGKEGEIVEYAVKMRKLGAEGFLDKLVAKGNVRTQCVDRIAARLKEFYLSQHPSQEIERNGQVDALKVSTDENFHQIEAFIGRTVTRAAFEAIRFYTNDFFSRQAGLFAARVDQHRIRDCHGDLHLDHIHLTPQALNIYDCIEFNDRFRYIDLANDIAFLGMDLDFQARADLADHFANRMAEELDDPDMLRLMNFYKCYRAVVRGKVESLHSVAHAASAEEREASADKARRYFRLALQYAVAGARPLALIVMGRIGSGKSTVSRAISEELGWSVFSSDRVRKEMAGVQVNRRADKETRSRLYSSDMTGKTYAKLCSLAREEIKAGRAVVLDATFGEPEQRRQAKSFFESDDVPYRFIELCVDDETVKKRLAKREESSREMSDARLEDFEMLSEQYTSPSELNETEVVRVEATGGLKDNVSFICKALAALQVEG